jgi:hypothetical protein
MDRNPPLAFRNVERQFAALLGTTVGQNYIRASR